MWTPPGLPSGRFAASAPERRHGLVGGPLPAVMGAVGGGEIEEMSGLTGEEEPVLEELGQLRPRTRPARQGAAIRAAD